MSKGVLAFLKKSHIVEDRYICRQLPIPNPYTTFCTRRQHQSVNTRNIYIVIRARASEGGGGIFSFHCTCYIHEMRPNY